MTSSEVKNVPPAGGKPKGKPWYRQATPFLVFAGPAVVVVASLVSAYLAFSREDDLVTQNYYQTGEAINDRIKEDAHTAALKLDGQMLIDLKQNRITLKLDNPEQQKLPPVLQLDLQHPTQEKLDQHVVLSQLEPGQYQANLEPTTATRWHVMVQNENAWRLEGEWNAADAGPVTVKPAGHSVAVDQ
ncbi:FixH family protein [Silvimonas sp. JCM 19000]